jgi:hypothetical protein
MNSVERCWRPERGGELSAWKKWLSPWQLLRWSPDMHPVSHRDEVQRLGMWRATAAARRRWDLSDRPTAGGYDKLSRNSSTSWSDAEIFTGLCLSDGHGARITMRNWSTATDHRRWDLFGAKRSDHLGTLYHGEHPSDELIERLGARFTPDFVWWPG